MVLTKTQWNQRLSEKLKYFSISSDKNLMAFNRITDSNKIVKVFHEFYKKFIVSNTIIASNKDSMESDILNKNSIVFHEF